MWANSKKLKLILVGMIRMPAGMSAGTAEPSRALSTWSKQLAARCQDGGKTFRGLRRGTEMIQSIRLDILGAGTIRKSEFEASKKERPAGFSGVQMLGCAKVLPRSYGQSRREKALPIPANANLNASSYQSPIA